MLWLSVYCVAVQVPGKLVDLSKNELIELIQQLERELVTREATLRDIVVRRASSRLTPLFTLTLHSLHPVS